LRNSEINSEKFPAESGLEKLWWPEVLNNEGNLLRREGFRLGGHTTPFESIYKPLVAANPK